MLYHPSNNPKGALREPKKGLKIALKNKFVVFCYFVNPSIYWDFKRLIFISYTLQLPKFVPIPSGLIFNKSSETPVNSWLLFAFQILCFCHFWRPIGGPNFSHFLPLSHLLPIFSIPCKNYVFQRRCKNTTFFITPTNFFIFLQKIFFLLFFISTTFGIIFFLIFAV